MSDQKALRWTIHELREGLRMGPVLAIVYTPTDATRHDVSKYCTLQFTHLCVAGDGPGEPAVVSHEFLEGFREWRQEREDHRQFIDSMDTSGGAG